MALSISDRAAVWVAMKPSQPSVLRSGRKAAAFSLIEVILAVGIFATIVTVVLALLPPLTRQSSRAGDTLVALRLPDAVRGELQRLATTGGFDALAAQTAPLTPTLPPTLSLVAAKTADRLHSLAYIAPPATGRIAPEERYFLVEVWRFAAGPLVYDPAGSVLALHVRVSWPYSIPGMAGVVAPADRDEVTFNLALRR